jgi:hypothetical protein
VLAGFEGVEGGGEGGGGVEGGDDDGDHVLFLFLTGWARNEMVR